MGVAKVCFIPSPENNHWPLALRHHSLAYVSVLLILTKVATIVALAMAPNIADLSTITQNRMVQLTNQARKEAGLPALSINSKLGQAAALKGQDMLSSGYFAHISPSGVTPWFWMKKTAYEYTVAGENLAIDFGEAEDVVSAWLQSPSHKANLLNKEYTETGIAVVSGEFQGGTSTIVVHMFGRPLYEEQKPAGETQEELPPQTTPAPKPSEPVDKAPVPSASPLPVPRTPRIALTHAPADSTDNAAFAITGDPGNAVELLIGNQERSRGTIPENGTIEIVLSSSSLPPGTVIARAIAKNNSGAASELSDPLAFENPKPLIASEYSLLLSPAFDQQEFALSYNDQLSSPQVLSIHSPVAMNAQVISAAPSFTIKDTPDEKFFITAFLHASRKMAGIITLIVAILLTLALSIKMRARPHHPALIAHASVIILFSIRFILA